MTNEQIEDFARRMTGLMSDSACVELVREIAAAERDVPDTLLVDLFYAAQGDITKFRIKARELLTGARAVQPAEEDESDLGRAVRLVRGTQAPPTSKVAFAQAAPVAGEGGWREAWVPEVLSGPSNNVCWTQDMVPRDERINAVVISQADYDRACAALAKAAPVAVAELHAECCDTPSLCSSVRRCTAKDAICDHNYVSGQCAKCGCVAAGE